MSTTLISEVKNYLDITWDDEDTNTKLQGIIMRAENILNLYAGCSVDFETGNEADKQLLFDCCRYIYCNAYEDFKNNFGGELIMLRARYSVVDANAE